MKNTNRKTEKPKGIATLITQLGAALKDMSPDDRNALLSGLGIEAPKTERTQRTYKHEMVDIASLVGKKVFIEGYTDKQRFSQRTGRPYHGRLITVHVGKKVVACMTFPDQYIGVIRPRIVKDGKTDIRIEESVSVSSLAKHDGTSRSGTESYIFEEPLQIDIVSHTSHNGKVYYQIAPSVK